MIIKIQLLTGCESDANRWCKSYVRSSDFSIVKPPSPLNAFGANSEAFLIAPAAVMLCICKGSECGQEGGKKETVKDTGELKRD